METNHHHINFPRREHNKTKQAAFLRSVLQLELRIPVHRELHANAPPVPVPSPNLSTRLIAAINGYRGQVAIDHAIDELERLIEADTKLAEESLPILDNFKLQVGIIASK